MEDRRQKMEDGRQNLEVVVIELNLNKNTD